MSSISAPFVTSLWTNYDFERRRPRYVAIDGLRNIDVHMYWFDTRSPFSEFFHYTLNVFFEGGLLDKWQEQSFHKYRVTDKAANRQTMELYSNSFGLVTFADLTLVWVAWLVGLRISLLGLIAEFLIGTIQYLKSIQLS